MVLKSTPKSVCKCNFLNFKENRNEDRQTKQKTDQ